MLNVGAVCSIGLALLAGFVLGTLGGGDAIALGLSSGFLAVFD